MIPHPALFQTADERKIAAVRAVVTLAREVERACRPRLRTDPPTPFTAIPTDLKLLPAWAEVTGDGGYTVTYGALHGRAHPRSVRIAVLPRQTLPPRSPPSACAASSPKPTSPAKPSASTAPSPRSPPKRPPSASKRA